MRPGMSDQLGEEGPSETSQAWDSARRIREPVAWTLLVLTAIGVLVGAWQLFSLPGAPVITVPGPVPATTFGLRASAGAPQFVTAGIITVPVVAVILVTFPGGLTELAPEVVKAAGSIQAATGGRGRLRVLGAL